MKNYESAINEINSCLEYCERTEHKWAFIRAETLKDIRDRLGIEPKRGHLERLLKDKMTGEDWYLCVVRCTCCGHLMPILDDCVGCYNYCPNCGAMLKEASNETD